MSGRFSKQLSTGSLAIEPSSDCSVLIKQLKSMERVCMTEIEDTEDGKSRGGKSKGGKSTVVTSSVPYYRYNEKTHRAVIALLESRGLGANNNGQSTRLQIAAREAVQEALDEDSAKHAKRPRANT
jgi:hypothetical protein